MDTEQLSNLIREYKLKNSFNYYDIYLCTELQRFIKNNEKTCFDRNNLNGHITAGGIVVCENFVLLNHHKKLNKWLGFGGHAEAGEFDPFYTACREVREESGIIGLKSNGVILDIDKFTFKHDEKPAHIHYDFRYLFVAKEKNAIKSNESTELVWMPIDNAIGYASDFAVKKLLSKYKRLYEAKKRNTPIEDLVK